MVWQVAQTPVTPESALCSPCRPATFGNDVPDGGWAWQEVQFALVSGDFAVMLPVAPSPWHTVQAGAVESGEALPVSAWQTPQLEPNPPDVTPVWAEPRKGTEWLAPPAPVQENPLWGMPWQVNVPHVCPWAV
jgi:hypothetical protein